MPQPGQGTTGLSCTGLHYATITGDAPVCIGDVLRIAAPSLPAADRLDLSGLTSAQRATLVAQVRADAGGVSEASFGADSYGGGKDLYRVANLYRLATQLDLDDVAAGLQQQLVTQIDQWTDPDGCGVSGTRCFAYDDTVKGLVGQAPSFGSDEFNDHHFHYGYLLSAAAIVADGSDDLVAKWKPVLDLVADDIASPRGDEVVPGAPRVRPVRTALVGLRVLAVRGREQPGVVVRGGVGLERARPLGTGLRLPSHRTTRRLAAGERGCISAARRPRPGPPDLPPGSSTPSCP
ncbi:glycosyl hydrolase [Curtobacterium sp. MCPF17_052]|nr:glycosyl hydrolase [Curtobacterium sp. MCPF17_052]WIB13745.1 glycosyl hydrolase [Curtobacterium sp. MCPF17_052]